MLPPAAAVAGALMVTARSVGRTETVVVSVSELFAVSGSVPVPVTEAVKLTVPTACGSRLTTTARLAPGASVPIGHVTVPPAGAGQLARLTVAEPNVVPDGMVILTVASSAAEPAFLTVIV